MTKIEPGYLTSTILRVLEHNTAMCLDNGYEREEVAFSIMQELCKEWDIEDIDSNIAQKTIKDLKHELVHAKGQLRHVDQALDKVLTKLGVSSKVEEGDIMGRIEYLAKQRDKVLAGGIKSENNVYRLTELEGYLQDGLETCKALLGDVV